MTGTDAQSKIDHIRKKNPDEGPLLKTNQPTIEGLCTQDGYFAIPTPTIRIYNC